MNRVPWLGNRETSYQESATGGTDVAYPAGISFPVDTTVCAAEGSGMACGATASNDCRGDQIRARWMEHGGSAETPGYENHSRFHPVPSQPVFSPQSGADPVSEGQMPPEGAAPLTPDSRPIQPTPVPAEPEVIPTPPVDSNTGWEARGAGWTGTGSSNTSWIFHPSAKDGKESAAVGQLHAQNSKRRIIR